MKFINKTKDEPKSKKYKKSIEIIKGNIKIIFVFANPYLSKII